MNFSEVFIRRPVATILLMVAIGFFGAIAPNVPHEVQVLLHSLGFTPGPLKNCLKPHAADMP